MRIPATLVVALASVLAGSLVLSGLFTNMAHFGHEVPEAKAALLPLNVIEQFRAKQLAGDAEAGSDFLKVDEEFVDPENHCEFCTRVEYVPGPLGLAGFSYESASGLDLTGAKKVRFWMMGEEGDEKIRFKVAGRSLGDLQERAGGLANRLTEGIFDSERFALTTEQVSLGDDWKKYEVDLAGVDLQRITHPFGFELAKGSGAEKQVVYIKGVIFDTEPPEDSLAIVAEEAAEPMQAEIISNGTSDTAPASFEFEANVTGGLAPYSARWDFGDGGEDDGQGIAHAFEQAGEYNVTLSVTDSEDQNASDSIMIEVAEPEEQPEQNDIDVVPPANTSDTEIPEDQPEGQGGNGTDTSGEEQQAEAEQETPPVFPESPDMPEIELPDMPEIELPDMPEIEIPDLPVPELALPELDVDPEVSAGIDLVTQPGDRVLLGGEVSDVDPETEGLEYEWTQISGPEVEFDAAGSLNPTITIPDDLERDARIVLQLEVDYQGDTKDRDNVRISVDYVDEIEDAEEESIVPSANELIEWDGDCDNGADCMGDDSASTFAATSEDGAVNLFSFEEFDMENVDEIERVTAIVTAKKTGETGYLSLLAAEEDDVDDYEESLGVSILSDSFDEYELVWEENPATGRPWTVESLNSLVAGYMYAAGQGDVQVSEFELVVAYTTEEPPVEETSEVEEVESEEEVEEAEIESEVEEPEPVEPAGNSTSSGNSTGS